jgi:choline-sulfatase
MVRLLDDAVARVVDALRQRGLWDDALVIFTADHGDMLGSHRLWQKMCMYEESIRVPMLVKPPGGAARSARSQLTQHLDLAATFCDYAGAELMDGAADASLRPIIERPDAPGRDAVFCEFNGNSGRGFQQRCVITPTHKLIYNHRWDLECYDLAADPGEKNNLCADGELSTLPAPAGALCGQLGDWMRDTGDYIEMELT